MKPFRDGFRLFLGLAAAALILPACGHTHSGGVVNAPGVLQFLAATVQVDEEVAGGTVTLTVTRTGGSAGAVSVDYVTAFGSAGAGDFTAIATSTLNWLDGEAVAKTFTVSITPDALPEGSEFFTAELSNATGSATIGPVLVCAVEILDTVDSPTSGALQFSAASYPTAEGVNVTVTVTRTGGSTDAISVEVDVNGGTAAGADYTDPPFPVTLSWGAGVATAQSFDIAIVDDAIGAGDAPVETILLLLQNPANVTSPGVNLPLLGTTQTASVNITDSDNTGTVAFTAAAFTVAENSTPGTITVTRSGGTQGAASVEVSVTLAGTTAVGGGTDYNDLVQNPFVATWADGVGGDVDIFIGIVDDGASDGDLNIVFGLANAVGATLGAQASTTLTITDNEVAPSDGEIVVSVSPNPVAESAAGTGQVTVTLTRQNGSLGQVDVTVSTAGGTATSATNPAAKQDFVALVNAPLSWAAGELGAKTVTITILNNDGSAGATGDTFLGTETFTVNVSVTAGTPTVTGSGATVTIQDD